MKRIPVSTLVFDLTREVPETIEEYNGLAPKRENPVLEDATATILYRSTFAKFRDTFLDAIEKETNIPRQNFGTEKEPQWESDKRYLNRVIASLGLTEESFAEKYQALAQEHMDKAPFNPSEREASDGPTIGKKDKALAEELVKRGEEKVAQVAAILSAKLGRAVATDVDSLARAFADNRRAEAKKVEEAQKAELGL